VVSGVFAPAMRGCSLAALRRCKALRPPKRAWHGEAGLMEFFWLLLNFLRKRRFLLLGFGLSIPSLTKRNRAFKSFLTRNGSTWLSSLPHWGQLRTNSHLDSFGPSFSYQGSRCDAIEIGRVGPWHNLLSWPL
jgi:hypothetical protein